MWRVLIIVAMVTLVAVSCDNDHRVTNPQPPDLSVTPMEDEQAELMALWVSGEIVAPTDLYNRILEDRALIEDQWGDSLAAWAAAVYISVPEFLPPWHPSLVHIGLDDTAYQSIMAGENTRWNQLATELRLDTVTYLSYDSITWHGSLRFEGRLHPARLAEHYFGFPGAEYAQTSMGPGDYPNCFPIFGWNSRNYLYRMAWGDCPSGCPFSNFYYLRVVGGSVSLAGVRLYDHQGEEPEWWTEEALPTLLRYWEDYVHWERDE